ncbi:MAG: AAA family ATPase [Proteobacteria bacterium]|nr:AAA family ATPase [Pseudomonadota bacterium]MBU1640341.1 AAA family ATPase [Pseudomonadota bacterium]
MEDLVEEVVLYVKSRYPILYIISSEENRAERLLEEAARKAKKPCYFWSMTEGFYNTDRFSRGKDPFKSLAAIMDHDDPGIFVLKDFHAFFDQPQIIRKLRDLVANLKKSFKTVCIIAPALVLPPGLENAITPIDIPLPNTEDLKRILMDIITPLTDINKITANLDAVLIEKVVNAARGLTEMEAENLFAKLVVRDKSFDAQDLPFVVSEKKKVIRKSGMLDYYDFSEDMKNVGGLDMLKKWLSQRGLAFSQKARDFGLPEPKGLLLLGVQGCGKSLAAKATASLWSLPLLKLDVGKIFDSYIGSSEKNMRDAIKIAESLAPNILWMDEIDKAFSGMGSKNDSDSGTSARVFGTFLTWMQEKTAPVFVIATANNIEKLPPELLRKGRFDEIFFIDLPDLKERKTILAIHFKKRNRNPDSFDIEKFAVESVGFTGAELEQLVISGLYRAFAESREVSNGDILTEIKETVPLSVTYKEKIGELRQWAEKRARPAS